MIITAPASGTLAPAIARLAAAGEDTVRDVIHTFNDRGLAALDPRRAGGRPRLISDGDIEVIVTAARTWPEKPVQPFTRWSLRKLAGYLAGLGRPVRIGRERLRQLLFVTMGNLAADKTRRSGAGPGARTPGCASRPRTHPGPIRSGRSPVRYAPLSWAAQATGITPRWPASCRPACAGVMPTPATPACWPPSAVNAPASAANASNAGAARNLKLHNRAGERSWPAH